MRKNENYKPITNDTSNLKELIKKKNELFKITDELTNATEDQKKEFNQYQVEIDQILENGANL